MKILLISKTAVKGGSASGVNNLVEALRSVNQEVVVETADQKTFIKWIFRGIEYVFNRFFFEKGAHFFKFYASSLNIEKLVKAHNPDIVQLCNVSDNCIDMKSVGFLSVPVVHRLSDFWPYHGPLHYSINPYSGFFSAPLFKLINGTLSRGAIDIIVAPSTWTKTTLERTMTTTTSIEVVPNAVNIDKKCLPRNLKSTKIIRFGVISVNLNTPRKGIKNIVIFLEELNKDIRVELYVYGNGPVFELNDVSFKVLRCGRYKKTEIDKVFQSFDILLYPAYLENSANTITEALSVGVPLIAQSGTGNDYYVESDVGFLFDFKNSTPQNRLNFTRLVFMLMKDYLIYSQSCLKTANQKFSHKIVGKKYEKIYQKLLQAELRERFHAEQKSDSE